MFRFIVNGHSRKGLNSQLWLIPIRTGAPAQLTWIPEVGCPFLKSMPAFPTLTGIAYPLKAQCSNSASETNNAKGAPECTRAFSRLRGHEDMKPARGMR